MKLILCADDFGQTEGIDQAIIQLIAQKRLSAASCMTLSPRWKEAAKLITPAVRKQAAIGLHLDFTHFGLAYSHPKLILLSNARILNKALIRDSIDQQLDNFETELGTPPDYVDGHQHVHQLPQIRDILLEALTTRYGKKLPWLRIARPPLNEGIKAWIIRLLGANALQSKAQRLGFNYSDSLLGVYEFTGDSETYKNRLSKWMRDALSVTSGNAPVLMCHPSVASEDKDAIYGARLNEFEVLNTEFIDTLLKQHNIQLAKQPS